MCLVDGEEAGAARDGDQYIVAERLVRQALGRNEQDVDLIRQ
jgi:hypothetical protein